MKKAHGFVLLVTMAFSTALAGCVNEANTLPTNAPLQQTGNPPSEQTAGTDQKTVDKDKVTVDEGKVNSIKYTNNEYGFTFSLPASWKGYQIVTDKWEGTSTQQPNQGKVTETGPLILIRHPEWKKDTPRQDIPVMVFTLQQWNSLQKDQFHIGAAPINPRELGRTQKYVFALPARYNFAFLPGYEEVEKLIEGGALQPIGK